MKYGTPAAFRRALEDRLRAQALENNQPLARLRKMESTRHSARDLGDWFEFEVGEPAEAATGAPGRGFRFPIRSLLDGRQFENFHLDVGYGDPLLETPDVLAGPDILAFAEIAPARVRCYPLTRQVAEKLHTYTRT